MNLLVFKKIDSFEEFINFWSQFYDFKSPFEQNYINHIKIGKPFNSKDILELFEWQNHSGLGKIRIAAIKDKIIPHLDFINDMKFEDEVNMEFFKEKFATVAAVSQTFLLHIIKPDVYPIYDQNIHVAYYAINGIDADVQPFPVRQEDRLKFYFRKLVPFINTEKGSLSLKKIDEALNSYGLLIKKNPKFSL